MRFDVVCVGSPFLDLIFHELSHLPTPGEEVLAKRLTLTPGGIANVAYACKQLGLESAICAPRGVDALGQVLDRLIEESGVHWVGRTTPSTPISVAIPADRDRGFITVNPNISPDIETLATIETGAVVANLPNVAKLPAGLRTYAILGDPEAVELSGKLTGPLDHIEALFLNEREATLVTCIEDADEAVRVLADLGTTVVMTRGPRGAVAVTPSGEFVSVSAPALEVPDPTGAGDAFTAAYIWADLRGEPLHRRMEVAVLYASRSIGESSVRQKGLPLEDFLVILSEQSS